MGFWDFLKTDTNEPREQSTVRYGNTSIDSFFGGESGLTEEQALEIPAVASSVDLIAGSIAQLDFYLTHEKNGENERIEDDYRLNLLNKQPNETMDAFTFKRTIVKDYLLYGAANAVIEKNLNSVSSLYLIPTKDITTQIYVRDGYKKYSRTYLNSVSGKYSFEDYELLKVLRNSNDGFTGEGVLKQNKDVFIKAINEGKYSSNILKNGAVPIGVLKAQSKLSPQAFANLKKSWANLYQGTEQAGKTVILEEGLDYQSISMNPNDLQLIDSKKDTISDIARVFNIPETMLNSNAGKYGSAEQNSMHFLQYCLGPIVSSIESALNNSLLLEEEKESGYSFKIDSSKLLQMTRKEKADAIAAEYKNGLISFYEARKDLDKNPKVNEDYFRLGLGDVIFKYETDEIIIPNTMQSKAAIEDNNKALIEDSQDDGL